MKILGLVDQVTQLLHERGLILRWRKKNHSRLGTKLPCPQSEGCVQTGGDLLTMLAQCAGKQENRVRAAHFPEERNRLRARSRQIHQSPPCITRTGEAHGLDERVSHERDAYLDAAVEKQRKNAFG